jgi:hypothetical protein
MEVLLLSASPLLVHYNKQIIAIWHPFERETIGGAEEEQILFSIVLRDIMSACRTGQSYSLQ